MPSQAAAAAQLAVMRDEEALAALVRVAAEVTTDSPLPACLTEHSGALPLHCQVGGGGGVGGRVVGCRGGRVAVGGREVAERCAQWRWTPESIALNTGHPVQHCPVTASG